MTRNRAFWVALVLFLGLAAYLRYYELRRPAGAPEAHSALLEVEPASVRAITCVVLPDSTRMEKRNGEWFLTWPVDFPADPVAVEALLSRCRRLEVIRTFPMGEGNPARYGLAPPLVRIRLDLTDGSSKAIEFGTPAMASPAYYVRLAGTRTVGLIRAGEFENYFQRRTSEWRRPDLLLMKAADVASVDLISGSRHVRLARDDARSPWRLEKPFPGPADATVVSDYLKGLLAMRARSFPDDRPASLAPYGLEAPEASFVVTDARGRICRLDVGARFEYVTGPLRYARVEGMPNIFGVPPVYVDVARQEDLFFRARRVFNSRPGGLARLQVTAKGGSAVLEPDSTGAWRLRGDLATPGAPPPDRRGLVEAWVLVRADSILPARGPGSREVDWGRPTLVVEATGSDGAREQVEVGPPIEGFPDAKRWPARLVASNRPRPDEVFLLDTDTIRSALALLKQ